MTEPLSPTSQRRALRSHMNTIRRRRRARVAWSIVAAAGILGLGLLAWGASSPPAGGKTVPAAQATPSQAAAVQTVPEPIPAAPQASVVTPTPPPVESPTAQRQFSAKRAMTHVRALADIGIRRGGTSGERQGAEYIASTLQDMGYETRVQKFKLTNGSTSRNVIARAAGASERVIVLGAHMDSKRPSPGANDNGTGCGALLEIADILADTPATATVEFVFFGAEEMIDSNPDHHHFGSRYYVDALSPSEKDAVAGMISVDMIGYGPDFVVRSMKRGPQSMVKTIQTTAKKTGVRISYLRDPGESGWSDHEAFELAGIPAAWIEWRDDPTYHSTRDTVAHIKLRKVDEAGQLTLDTVRGLSAEKLEAMGR